MRVCLVILLLLPLALLAPPSVCAEVPASGPFSIAQMPERVSLAPWIQVMTDAPAAREPTDLPPFAGWRAPPAGPDVVLGGPLSNYDAKPKWLRFQLRNDESSPVSRVLVLHQVAVSDLRVFVESAGGELQRYQTGGTYPPDTRALLSRYFAFPVQLPAGTTQTWWLRVETRKALTLPVYLWRPDAFQQSETQDLLLFGGAFGVVAGLLLYNLILFLMLRERNYFWYVAYCFLALLASFFVSGYGLLQPDVPLHAIADFADGVCLTLAGAALLQFILLVLDLPRTMPRHYLPIRALQLVWLVSAVLLYLRPTEASNTATFPSLCALLYVYTVVLLAVSKRLPGAVQLLIGLTSLFSGAVWMLGFNSGVAAWSRFQAYGYTLSTALEMVLSALSLAAVYSRERELAAQQRLHAEQEKVRLLEESERLLELRVQDRTSNLQAVMRELMEAKEAAEAASAARGQFLANMSHELRTPLGAILGVTRIAQEEPLNPKLRGFLGRIERAGTGLLSLLNNVLDYSKLEANRLDLEDAEFNLADVMRGVSDLHAVRAEEKRLALTVEIGPNVPLRLKGDALRLGQVLNNLVANSLKFTAMGFCAVRVTAHPDATTTTGRSPTLGGDKSAPRVDLEFEVSDSGIGIEPAKIGRIFEAFEQADGSTTRRFGGTGLGLAICKALVEKMGGQIEVRSEPGRGSVFRFGMNCEVLTDAASAAASPRGSLLMTGASSPDIDEPPDPAAARCALERPGSAELRNKLQDLVASLEAADAQAISIFDALLPRFEALGLAPSLRQLGLKIHNFYFEEAAESLRELMSSLGLNDVPGEAR